MVWPKQGVGSRRPNLAWFQTSFNKENVCVGASFIFDVFECSAKALFGRGCYYCEVFGQTNPSYSFLVARDLPDTPVGVVLRVFVFNPKLGLYMYR